MGGHSSTSQIPSNTDFNVSLGQAKKARIAALEDDTFMESDGQDGPMSAFSQSLSKFKKSPKKKGRLRPVAYLTVALQLVYLQPVAQGSQMTTTSSLFLTIVKTMLLLVPLVLPNALPAFPF